MIKRKKMKQSYKSSCKRFYTVSSLGFFLLISRNIYTSRTQYRGFLHIHCLSLEIKCGGFDVVLKYHLRIVKRTLDH